jgi:alpha-glucosidase
VLLLTLRGTPFVFQGEELGLEDARIDPDRRVDPGGRDGCRAPIPWDAAPPHGWEGDEPWLPFPPEPAGRSVQAERDDPDSVLHLYRRLLALRRRSPALHAGAWERLPAPPDVLAYRRATADDAFVVLVSAAPEPRTIALGRPMTVCVASDGIGEGEPFTGRLGVDQAVVLR